MRGYTDDAIVGFVRRRAAVHFSMAANSPR